MKKTASLFLALLIALSFTNIAFSAADSDPVISNPYSDVDWHAVKQYKTALHTHTNASDGDITLRQSLERHLETGFDIVATTDHGTVNYSWSEENPNKFIHTVLKLVNRTEGDFDYLGSEGRFENGVSYKLEKDENGDDYLNADNGRVMMRVPYGIENNAVSVNAHVNSWFVDYHDNSVTQYEDAVNGVCTRGGLCVINHPGEYSKARAELHSENAYNEKDFSYRYLINKWAGLIEKYDNCIGIDMNSKGDDRTRFDRILWDKLLTRLSANGENVFAICSSDAHQANKIDTGFIYALMNSYDSASLKFAIKNGHIFGASHCIGNPDELYQIADALKQYYGETDLYNDIYSTACEMTEKVRKIESSELKADSRIGITWSCLDDYGYCIAETQPVINLITVDDTENTISVSTTDALLVRWISDGKLIATSKAGESVIDLDDYRGSLGNYIRAEVFGEGGVVYTEPFILNAQKNFGKSRVVDKTYFNLGFLDFLLPEIRNLFEIVKRVFHF